MIEVVFRFFRVVQSFFCEIEIGVLRKLRRVCFLNPLIDCSKDVSVVAKDCYLARTPIGSVAVVGPMRMKYPKVVAVVEFVADTVTEELKRF